MPLTACSDVSPAAWIGESALPWQQLVGFGPSGFPAYARLRHLPDPAYDGQSENDVEVEEDRSNTEQLAALLGALIPHTTTPDECYVCVWEGYGDEGAGVAAHGGAAYTSPSAGIGQPAQPGLAPAPPLPALQVPQVIIPHRAYFLFRGALTDIRDWTGTELRAGQTRLRAPEPAFLWPADHAWCIASDVDPHWSGIGARTHVIEQLLADTRLDVVPADPETEQPAYR